MNDQELDNNQDTPYRFIIPIALALIIVVAGVYILFFYTPSTNYTYQNISAEEAFDLINTSSNLQVVDVRGLEDCSKCQYTKGHLPGAEMISNYLLLYNSTEDILVYSKTGDVGEGFCKNLSGYVHGKVYNLEKGYEDWESKGYPTNDHYIYTNSFLNIDPSEAYELINTSSNLQVVDVRGLEDCDVCQFNKGHLPGAELNSNPLLLYDTTDDILVYSVNGSAGVGFCQDLTGHVYGKIYNLYGGYDAWVAAGFETK